MEGQQPTSPDERKVNGRCSDHRSNLHELVHTDLLNTNRRNDPATEQQQLEFCCCPVGGCSVEADVRLQVTQWCFQPQKPIFWLQKV